MDGVLDSVVVVDFSGVEVGPVGRLVDVVVVVGSAVVVEGVVDGVGTVVVSQLYNSQHTLIL